MEVKLEVECSLTSFESVADQLREDLEVHGLESTDRELEATKKHSNIDMKDNEQ